MGTSSDFGGGRSPAWTGLRRASTSFGKHGGDERAGRVLARLVKVLGGAVTAAAAAGERSWCAKRTAGRCSELRSRRAGTHPDPGAPWTATPVGSSRFEVIEGLLDQIAGEGDALEEQAARTAACDVLDELFGDAETYEELEAMKSDTDGVLSILQAFLAAYIYARLAPALDERLNRLGDANMVRRREQELRDYTRAVVALELDGRDPLTVDWTSDDGRELLDRAILAVFQQLEALRSREEPPTGVKAFQLRTDRSQRLDTDAGLYALDWWSGDQRSTVHSTGNFLQAISPSSAARDLLGLAVAVYCADKVALRVDAPDGFTRDLELRVPVSDPERFVAAEEPLTQALRFLTGDHWTLRFRPSSGRTKKKTAGTLADAVCLFSGGLDSLTGAIDLLAQGMSLVLLGHHEGGLITQVQTDLARAITNRYGKTHVRLRQLFLTPSVPHAGQATPLPKEREGHHAQPFVAVHRRGPRAR